MKLIYITGGIRSGKSHFAEKLAKERGTKVLYVATGVSGDGEMEQRIELHRRRRPANWDLWESPLDLTDFRLRAVNYDVILLDCLSTWVSNRLLEAEEDQIQDEEMTGKIFLDLKVWLESLIHSHYTVIVVSSEVGLGGVAMSHLGRWFQDVLGEANELVAQHAHEGYAVLSGIPLRIK